MNVNDSTVESIFHSSLQWLFFEAILCIISSYNWCFILYFLLSFVKMRFFRHYHHEKEMYVFFCMHKQYCYDFIRNNCRHLPHLYNITIWFGFFYSGNSNTLREVEKNNMFCVWQQNIHHNVVDKNVIARNWMLFAAVQIIFPTIQMEKNRSK